jgi:MoaA/NifB/PqqE/SkfB family radical SAM enzyme
MNSINDISIMVSELSNTHEVDGPHDLSEFFYEGDAWLYNFLKDHYKEEYAPNYRLVLYFDTDYYPYINAAGTLITKLQQYLMDLDISHFFIVILSSDIRIKEDLILVQQSYNGSIRKPDQYPIMHVQVGGIFPYIHIDNTRASTICMKLWNHFHVHTTGEVFPCCTANHKYPLGDISHTSPYNIMNSEVTTEIRNAMLCNKAVVQCTSCYAEEDASIVSSRMVPTAHELATISHNTLPDGRVNLYQPIDFDIRLNNICNLKCLMCTGSYSSKIAAEEAKSHNVAYQTLGLSDRRNTLDAVNSMMHKIESVYFAGGEPLIMDEHYAILKMLDSNVKISYNTNLTTFQYKGVNVLDLWMRFTDITVGASLDASYAHAEYIRNGTIWDDVIRNYDDLTTKCPHINFRVTSNVNVYNIFNLINFQQEWIGDGLLTADKFNVAILTQPVYLSIQILPIMFKELIQQRIQEHIAFLAISHGDKLITQWVQIQKFMFLQDNSGLITEFFKYTDNKDMIRQTSFDHVFTEFNGLRNYAK